MQKFIVINFSIRNKIFVLLKMFKEDSFSFKTMKLVYRVTFLYFDEFDIFYHVNLND